MSSKLKIKLPWKWSSTPKITCAWLGYGVFSTHGTNVSPPGRLPGLQPVNKKTFRVLHDWVMPEQQDQLVLSSFTKNFTKKK